MILKDLVKEVSIEEVKKRLLVLYPTVKTSLPGYEKVYKLLLKKRARKSTTIINVEWIEDEDSDSGGYWDVHGKEPNDDTRYALDLSTFSMWLGFTIGPEILTRKDKVSLFCHILWEMTFHGFSDKEVYKMIRTINRSLKEIKEGKGEFKEFKMEDFE